MILPASLSVLNAVYRGRTVRSRSPSGAATIGGMAALGPLVGGWLTTYASWHWAFLINVPIAIAVVIGVLLLVPETKDTTDKRGIDPYGTVLGTLGLGALVFGLIEGQNYGWFSPKREFTDRWLHVALGQHLGSRGGPHPRRGPARVTFVLVRDRAASGRARW
jgi:MFS family permease